MKKNSVQILALIDHAVAERDAHHDWPALNSMNYENTTSMARWKLAATLVAENIRHVPNDLKNKISEMAAARIQQNDAHKNGAVFARIAKRVQNDNIERHGDEPRCKSRSRRTQKKAFDMAIANAEPFFRVLEEYQIGLRQ